MLTEDTIEKIRSVKDRYPDNRSLVMEALRAVQHQKGGDLTRQDLEEIARVLDISPVDVQAAATFYSLYHVADPVGRYHIQVCRSISCSLLEADDIIAHLEKRLQIKAGGVTEDQKFSLTTVECLGSCGTAPMMQINDDYYENLTPKRVDEIIKRLP